MTEYDYSHHSEEDLFYVFEHGDKTPDYKTVLYDEIFDRVTKGALNLQHTLDFFIFYRWDFENYHHDLIAIFESCVRAMIPLNRIGMVVEILFKFNVHFPGDTVVNPSTHETIRAALFALKDGHKKSSLCCAYLCQVGFEFNNPLFFSDPTCSQLLFFAATARDTSRAIFLFDSRVDYQKMRHLSMNLEKDKSFYLTLSPEKKVDCLVGLIWFFKAYILYHRNNGFSGFFSQWANDSDNILAKLELLHQQEGKKFVLIKVPNSDIIL